jgi:hypothetical protein
MFPASIRVDAEAGEPERERASPRSSPASRVRPSPTSLTPEEPISPRGDLRDLAQATEPLFRLDELDGKNARER